MRIVGEVVTVVTTIGGGYDDDGYPLPKETVRRPIEGCVIIPKGQEVESIGKDATLASKDVSVLAPVFITDIAEGDTLVIRNENYRVSAPVFQHRSAFATGRGGTEIQAENVRVT